MQTALREAAHTQDDSFFVADMKDVLRQKQLWSSKLPRVHPFYAVKCNPDPHILSLLLDAGCGFDCASKAEIQMLLDLNCAPERLIYANPCKQASHLRFAAEHNVRLMTFDNKEELYKIKENHPNAQLVLRILTDDSNALCKLSLKFGACLKTVPELLAVVRELNLDLVGVSFHVGSGCFAVSAFEDAVFRARKVCDIAQDFGFQIKMLDIGGGFPGRLSSGITFEEVAHVLGPLLDKLFPPEVSIISEPGRFFCSAAYTLAVQVYARRTVFREKEKAKQVPSPPKDDESDSEQTISSDSTLDGSLQKASYMYYVNDGVYGSFNCILFDHATVKPQVLRKNGEYFPNTKEMALSPCSIWGPTCDSMDCIGKEFLLPELNVGDWLLFEDMGAYTKAAASEFNGFRRSNVIYLE